MNILTQFALKASDVNIPALKADDVLQNGLDIVYFVAGIIAVIAIILANIVAIFLMRAIGKNLDA